MEPRRSRTMEYDPVTGCYVRRVPLDFKDKKVEDIVKEEMTRIEKKSKSRSRNSEDKVESGADTPLVDLSLRTNDYNGDRSLPHYVSGKDMETEYQFSVRQEVKTESQPAGFDKNGEFVEEDIKKAGEEMKAKFDADRMRFERDSGEVAMSERSKRSFERRHRSNEDFDSKKAREDTKERRQSLDRRLKDMEERRARLLKGPSDDKPDSGEVTITRSVTTETSYSPPASEDSMLGERMQDAHRRHRNREERIKRRKQAEELMAKQTSAGDDKPVTKSAGVKLELRGSPFKKKEDSSLKSDSEPNAFSASSYSYHPSGDDASDITFTVKKPAETKKDKDDNMNFDKKDTTFDRNVEEQEAKNTAVSLMDEPLVWSQPSSVYPGLGTNDEISFTVKKSSNKQGDKKTQKDEIEKRENKKSIIKETEVKVVESKTVQSLFSNEEPQDIVFSVKDTSSSPKSTTPKEVTLERGSFDDKYSFTSTSNSDLLRREMDNVDSGKKSSEAENGDVVDGYRDSLRRTNALGRVGSFKKSREDLPPAIFHDIESDAPAAPMVDIRTDSPSPISKADNKYDTFHSPNILSKLYDEDNDEERRRRRLEIEEKKKRIAESQRKANLQRQRGVSSTEKKNDEAHDPGSTDSVEDLSEKRRSLLMMWESFAEGEGPGPENHGPEMETKNQPFGYDIMMMEAAQSDPNAGVVDYRTMDAEDEIEETRTPKVDIDEYHRLDDDELKWERAGQFQPGKLKTKFHEIGRDDSTSETKKTRTGVNNNNTTEMTSRVFSGGQRFKNKTPVEEDQSYAEETHEVESTPKLLWNENEGQSTSKSDDEDDEKDTRKPYVDIDEVHRMTQEEEKWENVGHFQPGKINTSVFESRKKTEQNVSGGSPKVQRREKSRYEQIKKIQRTDSKKELLVPKKVELRADRREDFQEEDEHERPYVGKIETPLFQGTLSEEERQRREREIRNRREMEEIQREKEEERRRQERDNLEGMTSVNEFEDDEFDAKVKSKDVRKIDITKFGDFQKNSLIKEESPASKQLTKRIVESRHEDKYESATKTPYYGKEDDGFDIQVRLRSVGKLSKDSSPFIEQDTSVKESNQSRKVDEMTASKMDDIVVEESPMEMASPPGNFEDDEFDNMTRARIVKKLDISRMPFSRDKYDKAQSQDNQNVVDNKALKYDNKDRPQERSLDKTPLVDERKKEREREKREWEEQLQRERDEIEQIKKAHDKAFEDNLKGGNEIDTNDSETETRNIRKLDLSMFSKFQQGNAGAPDKNSKRNHVQQAEVIVEAKSTSEVESTPDYRNEDDEYEIKRRSVGKLNKDWYFQAQEQEAKELELRRKEADKERIRKEQYEFELLHIEEKRRRENEKDEVLRDEPYFSEKPQQVKKLDSTTMSPFLKGGSPSPEGTVGLSRSKRNKDEVRQERKLARKESRSKMKEPEVLHAVETEDVQQSPEVFDDHNKEVGRLNTGKYLQMIGEDLGDKQRRKKLFEEERTRRELEEMERQREEEQRRNEMDRDDASSSSSSTKSQNINKLDSAQFSPFQKQDTVVMPKKSPTKEIPSERKVRSTKIIEKQTMDKVESEPLLPEENKVEWLEKERSEASMYEEKRQNVGKLDVNRLIQTRSEEDRERQSRIKELERQRIIKEREEVERLKAEKKMKKSVERDSEEVNRRKLDLEKERIQQETEEKERLRMEQQVSSENITISNVQEVHSAPDEDIFYERGNKEEREREEELSVEEKRKSIGRLDVNKFVQSISEEAEEKRRRKIELEKERIRRENEEKELLRLEQEGKYKEESNVTITEKSSKNYVILHRDSEESSDLRGERKERESSDKENYPNIERERGEELSVEVKRKNVGKLDFNRLVQSLGQEEEEKQRKMIELERERRRREKEEKELLKMEQERVKADDTGRSTATVSSYEQVSRTVVTDVQSSPYDQLEDIQHPSRIDKAREEELSVEEKRKSVGRLDVQQFFQSLNEEEEEKRKRRIKMDNERIKRENQEREILRMEQERSSANQGFQQVNASVVQEVHSSPSVDLVFMDEDKIARLEKERKEAMSVEDKRKSVGKLDVNQFIQSLGKEDKEKQMRKIELERERVRREQEERVNEEQLRLQKSSSYSENIQSSSIEVVHSEVPVEYEDRGSSPQDKKEVGRLDFQRFSQQFNQEARERERRAKDLEIERLLFEREEMKGLGGKRSVQDDSLGSERRETITIEKRKYSYGDDNRLQDKVQSVKNEESADGDKPVPKRLDLSKFSAFQSGTGTRTTKDDSNVKRRGKTEASRQSRPKSIAGTSFGGVVNGEARSGTREFRIIH